MTNETTKTGRLVMAIVAFLIGLYLLFVSPYVANAALNTPLHRLVEVFQVAQPNGVWDTPVGILTATHLFWIGAYVFAGATLVVISKAIYDDLKWARPLALTMLAIPSIGGMTMTIPWIVLVLLDPNENKVPGAPAPVAMPIMLIGLVGYFIMLLTEKSDGKTKIAQIVTFTALGVVGGMVWMNAQHGVRFMLARPSAPFFEPNESNPELFLGGFVMYAAVAFFIVTIYLLAARKEAGVYVGAMVGVLTMVVNILSYVDRKAAGMPSASDWMRGAILSLVLLVILLTPWFKDRVLGKTS